MSEIWGGMNGKREIQTTSKINDFINDLLKCPNPSISTKHTNNVISPLKNKIFTYICRLIKMDGDIVP